VQPGDYELRYVLNEIESVAARQSIKIVAAEVTIDAPAEVKAGAMLQFKATGPVAQGNWIGFAPVGSSIGTYVGYDDIHADNSSYELQAPEAPGDYELRFMAYSNDTVLASRPIKVVP
jgi:Ca-activated chloride channel homolog